MEASCKLLLVTVLANLVVGPCLGGSAPPPVWSRTYSVEGTLSIPYAEIEVKLVRFVLHFFSFVLTGAFCCLG